jgi:DegV family protein with EDD domain
MCPDPKRRVAVVTDSTADLPPLLAEQHGIHVIPQILILGDKTWLDGVDIQPPEFYRLLRTSPHFPSTSQPSAAAFEEFYTRVAAGAEGIVSVHVSSKLSGTINSALMARQNLAGVPIEIIDSQAVSMQLGFIALAAARAAQAGADLETVAGVARAEIDAVRVYFVVDTLEYLHRGGRIGAAARLFGTALNLKPVLEIRDGIVAPVAKIRTRRKALDKVMEVMEGQLAGARRVRMAVLHVASPEEAKPLADEVAARFHPVELIAAECGPVVGAHAGPGAVGVAYHVEER